MASTSIDALSFISAGLQNANYRSLDFPQEWVRCQAPRLAFVGLGVYSQVKSSSGATRPRGDHPDPNFFLPPPLRGLWRGLLDGGRIDREPGENGVGLHLPSRSVMMSRNQS